MPARLIGEWVETRISAEAIEVWYGQQKVQVMPRLRGRSKHQINYRHVIEWLVRKPGAFAGYRYRAELFPTSRFRLAYDSLAATASARADRDYLAILHLAARHGEAEVDKALRRLLDAGDAVSAAAVERLVQQGMTPARAMDVCVAAIDLSTYDALLIDKEAWHESGREGCEAAVDQSSEGTALADDARVVRDGGDPGPAGVAQLRALPVGTGRPGVRGAEEQACGTVVEGVAAAVGEEPGDVRSEASAGAGAAAGASVASG